MDRRAKDSDGLLCVRVCVRMSRRVLFLCICIPFYRHRPPFILDSYVTCYSSYIVVIILLILQGIFQAIQFTYSKSHRLNEKQQQKRSRLSFDITCQSVQVYFIYLASNLGLLKRDLTVKTKVFQVIQHNIQHLTTTRATLKKVARNFMLRERVLA